MNVIEIKMWGTTVGKAYLKEDNFCAFQYDDEFIKKGIEISPIVMPLSTSVYSFKLSDKTFKGLPGLLADSLPDKFGNAVIDAWLKKEGREIGSFTSLERLCYLGKRGMGALEFYPVLKNNVKNESEKVEIEHLVDLCNKILSERENVLIDEEDYINQLINVGTSAGGARAKAIIAYNEKIRVFKSGQIDAGEGFRYYIIKFGDIINNRDKEEVDTSYHTRIEYAYYLLAKKAGINMSESQLLHRNGYHFMTERFDRRISPNGKMQKIHMQTLGGLAHFDFNDPGSNSYEQVVPIMRKLGLSQLEVEEFFRRMVFNVVYKNCDDHVKNISFLMDKNGKWELSPAYDVSLAYNPQGAWTSGHQMLINGKRTGIIEQDILASGKEMGLKSSKCKEIIDEVIESKKYWMDFAQKASLPEKIAQETQRKFESLNKEQ